MKHAAPHSQPLTLVDPEERFALHLGPSTLFYRRLSLGDLAAIERQQTVFSNDPESGEPRALIPPHALEAAICAHVLGGWQGVLDGQGAEVEFGSRALGLLPGGVRQMVVEAAHQITVQTGGPK